MIDKLKQYMFTRLDNLLTQDVYTKNPKFDTNNDPENDITEPYILLKNYIIIEQTSIKTKLIMELEIHDFTADSTTVNTIADSIKDELHKSWQTESDIFFRTDLDWQADIPSETADKSRIDQRYEIQLYEKS